MTATVMRKELGLLNFMCLLVALAFLALAIISVISSGDGGTPSCENACTQLSGR